VVHGGRLTDHKGMNLPDGDLSVAALTDKDRADVGLALELGADLIALSFVRRAADVDELRGLLPPDRQLPIVAKIERPEALDNIAAIFATADAIMVARGDLGVELPLETLPGIQDRLVELGRRHGKPVIIATQMLDSMIRNPRPTRAEVVDVAFAVTSGADAVMLSGETAVGAYPLLTVEMMDRVIRQAEDRLWSSNAFGALALAEPDSRPMPLDDALRRSVTRLSRDLGVRAILVVSRSGRSGLAVSSARPAAPVVAVTDSLAVCRFFSLCWGIVPMVVDPAALQQPVELLRQLAVELDLAATGHMGLIVRGFRDDLRENQPSVTVVTI
jgi:pyruvate kinase